MKTALMCVLAGALVAGCGGSGTTIQGTGTRGSSGSGSSGGASTGGAASTGASTGLSSTGGGSTGGGSTGGSSGGTTAGGLCTSQACVVYADTASALYTIDPQNPTGAAQKLCNFGGDINGAAINDIAVDASGVLYALSSTALFRVGLTPNGSGDCPSTRVTNVAGSSNYNALSFTLDGTLLAAGSDGTIARINLQSGSSNVVGSFANGYGSSGDFVALSDGRIFATAVSASANDVLVEIGQSGGQYSQVVVKGDVGFSGVYGLGFWAGTLYGFDSDGDVLQIDPATGAATLKGNIGQRWYGAGTTPSAPIFQ